MKTLYQSLALLAVLAFSFSPSPVRAQDDSGDDGVSFQTFYDQLGSQGTWIQTDTYGYVFQPTVSDPNWAPYTDGHWVYTDAGWCWASDEPWGWATYHYGRWCNIDGTGWCWVPGYRWAPAWVSWRYGGGYCGWAPLPPESFVGAEYGDGGVSIGIGFHFGGDCDVNFHIGAGCYNFVHVGDLCQPHYGNCYVNRNNNYGIINHTTNITNINVNKTVINNNYGNKTVNNFNGVRAGGPPINEVNAKSSTPFQKVSLTSAAQPGKASLQGNQLAVYAPKVNPSTAKFAKPVAVSHTVSHPTLNRGDSIEKPLAVNSNLKPAPPSSDEVQAAKEAQLHAPASAKIATEKTPIKTHLNKPLTALEPVAHKPAKTTEEKAKTSTTEENKPATTTHKTPPSEPKEPTTTTTHKTPPSEPKEPTTTHKTPPSEPKEATTTTHKTPPSEPKEPTTTTHKTPPSEPKPPAQTYHPPAPVTHPAPPVYHPAPPVYHPPTSQGNKPPPGNTQKKPTGNNQQNQ